MNHRLPILDLAVLPLLNIYHWLLGEGWTPLIDLFFPDRPTPEQRAKAKRRLAIHKLIEDAWAEAVARPTPRWLCPDGHPMTEEEAEEALHADRERWQHYLDTGRL